MDNCVLGVRIYQCICWLNVHLDLNFNVDPTWHLRYAWRVFPGSPENCRYPIQYSYPKSCRSAQFCQRDGKRKSLASLFRLHFCTLLVFLDLSGVFWKVFRLVLCILCSAALLLSWVLSCSSHSRCSAVGRRRKRKRFVWQGTWIFTCQSLSYLSIYPCHCTPRESNSSSKISSAAEKKHLGTLADSTLYVGISPLISGHLPQRNLPPEINLRLMVFDCSAKVWSLILEWRRGRFLRTWLRGKGRWGQT